MDDTAWSSLVGHKWAVDLLRGALVNERVGHAYLFTGPEHIGKTTLARLFGQAINCLDPVIERRPCGQCRSCQLIAADRHPDVRLLEPEISGRGKRTLKIDEVRDMQHDLSLAAYEARSKVAILTYFDAATAGAANAFLKTLEEPPSNVILLLTAPEADALLPTITSRCRVMALRPLARAEVHTALLERWGASVDEARRLSHLADGRPGWARRALHEPALIEEREAHLGLLREAIPGDRVVRFDLAERMAKEAEILPDLLRTWLSWWRDATLLACGTSNTSVLVNVDQLGLMHRLVARWQKQQLMTALAKTREAVWQLEHNANARLVVENLLLTYPQGSSEAMETEPA